MMQVLRGGSLVLSTILMGTMTGAFLLYAHTIMPGLAKTDDRTFVGAFQALDRAIINPLFMFSFFGAFLFAALAAVLSFGAPWRPMLPWLIAALVLYLLVLILTMAINVPLNDALKAAGDPSQIDVAAARKNFNEPKWVQWNNVRSVASTASFACMVWALVIYGSLRGR